MFASSGPGVAPDPASYVYGVRGGAISTDASRGSAAPLEQEPPGRRILGEADRTVVCIGSAGLVADLTQEVCGYRPERLVRCDAGTIDRVGQGQTRAGPLGLSHRRSLRNSSAERGRHANELLVEHDQGGPVGAASLRALGVDRLNGRLQ